MPADRSAIAALMVEISGRFAKFDSAMQKATSSFQRTVKQFNKLGKELTKGLSLPFAGIAVAAYKATTEMDNALDKIVISTGKTGKALKGLEDDFNAVFTGKAAEAPIKVATAIGELNTRLGLTGKPLQDLATQMLVVSRLTETELNSNIKLSAQLFNQWGIATEKQAETLDILNKASQLTGANFNSLLSNVVQFGPQFRAAGFSIQQTTALLGNLEKNGVEVGKVMGGLNRAIATLSKAGVKDVPAALNALITDLKNTGNEALATARASDLFGKKIGTTMVAAIKAGAFSTEELQKALGDSAGSIEDARARTDGLEQTLVRIKNSALAAAAPLEGALNDALTVLVPNIISIIGKVADLVKKFAEMSDKAKAATITLVAIATGAGPLSYILSSVASSFLLVARSLRVLAALGAANPLAALSISLYAIYKMVQTDAFKRGLDIIGNAFYNFGVSAANSIKAASDAIVNFFEPAFERFSEFGTKIVAEAQAIYDGIKTHLVDNFNRLAGDFQRGLDVIYNGFKDLKDKLVGHSEIVDIDEKGSEHFEHLSEVAVESTGKATTSVASLWGAVSKETKKGTSANEKEIKRFKKETAKLMDEVEDAFRDTEGHLSPLAAKFKELLDARDVEGLKKMVSELHKSGESFDDLKEQMSDAKQESNEFRKATKDLVDQSKEFYEQIHNLPEVLDPAEKKLRAFMLANDSDAIKKTIAELGREGKTVEEIQKSFEKVQKSITDSMQAVQSFGNALAGLAGALGKVLGLSDKATSNISGAIGNIFDLISGDKASADFSEIGDAIGMALSGDFADLGELENLEGIANSMGSVAAVLEKMPEVWEEFGDGLDGIIKGASTSIGTAIGAYLGGPAGAQIGAQIGDAVGEVIGPLFEDKEHPDQVARRKIIEFLEEGLKGKNAQFFNSSGTLAPFGGNLVQGDGSQFAEGWADAFQQIGDKGFQVFNGLGQALNALLGTGQDVGPQIGFILASNLNNNINNARLLVQQLGLDFGDLEGALTQAANAGLISWLEFESALQGLNGAFEPGLEGLGKIDESIEEIIASGGRGMGALKGLRDLGVEAMEAGVADLDGLRKYLELSGKYTTQQIQQIFQALQQRGITSLEQLAEVSDRVGGGIIADLAAMGFAFAEVTGEVEETKKSIEEAGEETENFTDRLARIPKSVDTVVRVHTEEDSGGGGGGGGGSSSDETSRRVGRAVVTAVSKASSKTSSRSSGSKKSKSSNNKETSDEAVRIAEEVLKKLNEATGKALDFGSGDNFRLSEYEQHFSSLATSFNGMSDSAKRMGNSLSNAMRESLELTDDAAAKLAALFGSQFGESINAARHQVALLGFDFEELTTGLADLAKQGKITWADFAAQFSSLQDMFQPGIKEAAAYGMALDSIWASGGSGFDAIQGLRDMGIEALEAQIKSTADLKAALIALGRPADQVSKIFDQIAAQGITTTEELSQVTDVVAGQIIGNAAASGFSFKAAAVAATAAATAVDPEEQRLRDRLANAPSSYHRQQRQKALDDYLSNRMKTKGFFKGGVMNMPTKLNLGHSAARMAEFASEGMLPIKTVGGVLGVHAAVPSGTGSGGQKIQVTNVVNAPNATAGTAAQIEQILRKWEPLMVNKSAARVADLVRRGGSYSDVFRGAR